MTFIIYVNEDAYVTELYGLEIIENGNEQPHKRIECYYFGSQFVTLRSFGSVFQIESVYEMPAAACKLECVETYLYRVLSKIRGQAQLVAK